MRKGLFSAALLATLCSAGPGDAPVARVPARPEASVKIDGQLDAAEWKGAHEVVVAPDVTLLIFHTADHVYLGVRLKTKSPAYVDLFLLVEGEKRVNLHASMQVGEREVPPTDWTDRDPQTQWGRQDRWRANFVREDKSKDASAPLHERFVAYEGFEFQLSKERFGREGWRMRLEVRDFAGERKDIVFPSESDRFDPSSWGEFLIAG